MISWPSTSSPSLRASTTAARTSCLFVNGLPLAVIELKNAADEDATVWTAFNQLQTYKLQIPSLFAFNETLIVSDGLDARIGSLTADKERYMPWRTIEGEDLAPATMLELEVLTLQGSSRKRASSASCAASSSSRKRTSGQVVKKIAGYHQFHAVDKAVEATIAASRPEGDNRCGVVWHTQGSGKSLTMAFYAGSVILASGDEEPDAGCPHRPERPRRPAFRHVLSLPGTAAAEAGPGGRPGTAPRAISRSPPAAWCFTTIQKFMPEEKGDKYPLLSDRRNIVVIADEAHRSQYDFIDGYARHLRDALPNASFIGFTGTPIEIDRPKHAGRVRRLYQHLRHPAGGRGQGDRSHLLREPPGQAGAQTRGKAAARREFRGSDRRRGDRPERKAQNQMGRPGGAGRHRKAARS